MVALSVGRYFLRSDPEEASASGRVLERCSVVTACCAHARRCALGRRQTGLDTPGSMGPTVAPGPAAHTFPPTEGRNGTGPNRLRPGAMRGA